MTTDPTPTDVQLSAWQLAHEGLLCGNAVYRDVAIAMLEHETAESIAAMFRRADASNALLDSLATTRLAGAANTP